MSTREGAAARGEEMSRPSDSEEKEKGGEEEVDSEEDEVEGASRTAVAAVSEL